MAIGREFHSGKMRAQGHTLTGIPALLPAYSDLALHFRRRELGSAIDPRRHSVLWWHGFAKLHVVGDSADELCEVGGFCRLPVNVER